MLKPVGTTTQVFTPPSSLDFKVELSERYSRRWLFHTLSSITFQWSRNDSTHLPSGVLIWDNALSVPTSTPQHAGSYSVAIESFGFSGVVDKVCAAVIREALINYAVFRPVHFEAINSEMRNNTWHCGV